MNQQGGIVYLPPAIRLAKENRYRDRCSRPNMREGEEETGEDRKGEEGGEGPKGFNGRNLALQVIDMLVLV